MQFEQKFGKLHFYIPATGVKFTYGLLTKCEVKMAGYWPHSFLAAFFLGWVSIQVDNYWLVFDFVLEFTFMCDRM